MSEQPKDLSLLRQMLASYDPAKVDPTVSARETMTGANYMWVGASAAEIIMASVMASKLTAVNTVLDLPCGHGRVLRHLVRLFPDADFDVCDLDADGVEFCRKTFGAGIVPSSENLTKTAFSRKYDLIWIGSLFTHTSREVTSKSLRFLAEQLTENGIIVASFHGRWAPRLHRLTPYMTEEQWREVMRGYETDGYGYADYFREQSHGFIEGSYGISVAKPQTLVEMIGEIPGVRLFLYQERAWGENHDVIAFGKPDWDTATWSLNAPPASPPEGHIARPAPARAPMLKRAERSFRRARDRILSRG